jgi:hypothetical protein
MFYSRWAVCEDRETLVLAYVIARSQRFPKLRDIDMFLKSGFVIVALRAMVFRQ